MPMLLGLSLQLSPVLQPSFEDYAGCDRMACTRLAALEPSRQRLDAFLRFEACQTLVEKIDRKPASLAQLACERLGNMRLRSRRTVHIEWQTNNYPRDLKFTEARSDKFEVAPKRTPFNRIDRMNAKASSLAHRKSDPFSPEIEGSDSHH
jgi:hypothetical protein